MHYYLLYFYYQSTKGRKRILSLRERNDIQPPAVMVRIVSFSVKEGVNCGTKTLIRKIKIIRKKFQK